jgi:hypothetical protein
MSAFDRTSVCRLYVSSRLFMYKCCVPADAALSVCFDGKLTRKQRRWLASTRRRLLSVNFAPDDRRAMAVLLPRVSRPTATPRHPSNPGPGPG